MTCLPERRLVQEGGCVLGRPAAQATGLNASVDDIASALIQPWYVVHVKVRQESVASDNLERQGYSVYLPQIKVLKRRRGRHQPCLIPLFPRYLFLQPGSPEQSIAPVRSTLGVAGIVRFGQDPAVMQLDTLRSIRDFEIRQNATSEDRLGPFQRDDRVRVVGGPLAGLEGLITDVARDRVIVLMHLLGQDTRVRICHHQLLLAN